MSEPTVPEGQNKIQKFSSKHVAVGIKVCFVTTVLLGFILPIRFQK